jgi:hypothetical protein
MNKKVKVNEIIINMNILCYLIAQIEKKLNKSVIKKYNNISIFSIIK